ncbi:hypothetical protein [Streptomyces rhizosphaerihabitans]|uniref:hypothetical protein n=1 Tax=Streptomyces rhizosphaerihabitans TaxID=1266770 RepID=UPI0021C0F1D2|nr:hypothetical protein [Streptomyces rhizosphaerihabitans]MCT9009191.1 hypothetical protein [Streptomyces rhizosphaerihabitans]
MNGQRAPLGENEPVPLVRPLADPIGFLCESRRVRGVALVPPVSHLVDMAVSVSVTFHQVQSTASTRRPRRKAPGVVSVAIGFAVAANSTRSGSDPDRAAGAETATASPASHRHRTKAFHFGGTGSGHA